MSGASYEPKREFMLNFKPGEEELMEGIHVFYLINMSSWAF